MTVQEVKKRLEALHYRITHNVFCNKVHNAELEALNIAIKSTEELEQYRALGTVEELKEAREKQVAKKPIRKEMPYNEEVGFNDEWYCPVCNSYVGYFTEGMSEPEQMEYCNECGQHIAKDWSEEDD